MRPCLYAAGFLGTMPPVFAGLIADNFGTRVVFLYGGSATLLPAFALSRTRLPRTANQLAQDRS